MWTKNKKLFGDMFATSRTDAGKSQEYMAHALGISKKTVQNWEAGVSCPSQVQGFEWFDVLGVQPLPYYLRLLYPEIATLQPVDTGKNSDAAIDAALLALLHDLPTDTKKKILFIAYGDHGSSPLAVLEMIVAHLHVPLMGRLNIAHNILNNYELAKDAGVLVAPAHIKPNMRLLEHAYNKGKTAVKMGLNGYSSIE